MKADRVCHLREAFIDEWRSLYPSVPPPVLRGLSHLCESDVIDESSASGYVCAVSETLCAVNDKIRQLREQVERKLFFQQFLVRVISVLDEENGVKVSSDIQTSLKGNQDTTSFTFLCSSCGKKSWKGLNNSRPEPENPGSSHVTNPVDLSSPDKQGENLISRKRNFAQRLASFERKPAPKARATDSTHSTQSTQTDISENTANVSRKDLSSQGVQVDLDKAKEVEARSNSGKFISCIQVTDNKAQRPTSLFVDKELSATELDKPDNAAESGDEGSYDNAQVENKKVVDYDNKKGEEEEEMFRRKKSNATKPNSHNSDEHTRDNFMAVSSRRNLLPYEATLQEQHANKSSPKLPRNFNLLKMTSGFDLVMDDGSSENQTIGGSSGAVGLRDKIPLSKQKSDSEYDREPFKKDIMARNSAPGGGIGGVGKGVDITLHSSPSRGSGSDQTTQQLNDNYSNHDGDIVTEKSTLNKINNSTQGVSVPLDTCVTSDHHHQQQHLSEDCNSNNTTTEPAVAVPDIVSSTTERTPHPTKPKPQVVPRTSFNRGGPPPPVAKKPIRHGSGKKLPEIPHGVQPFVKPNDTGLKSAQITTENNEENPTGKQSENVQDRTALFENLCKQANTVLTEIAREKPTAPTLSEIDRDSKLHEEVERITGHPSNIGDRTASPLLHSDASGFERVNLVMTNIATSETSRPTSTCITNPAMRFENNRSPLQSHDENRSPSRSSVSSLVEGASEFFILAHTRPASRDEEKNEKEEENLNKDSFGDSPSSSDISKPLSPQDYNNTRVENVSTFDNSSRQLQTESDVDNPTAEQNNETLDYHRTESSTSTDTIVNERLRSQSFSSDVDVKDAIYSLESVLKSETSDTSTCFTEENQPNMSSKPKPKARSRVHSYENWTLNKALTSSITRHPDLSDEDEEFDDDDDGHRSCISSSSATTSPHMKRDGSSTGSKDSGLCDDMGTSQEGLSLEPSVEGSNSENELISGRFRDLKAIQQMAMCAEEEEDGEQDTTSLATDDTHLDKDLDSTSVASDFEFTHSQDDIAIKRQSRGYGTGGNTADRRSGASGFEDRSSMASMASDKTDVVSLTSSGDEDNNVIMDSSYDETYSAREGILKMRQLLVKGVLDSEKAYLDILSLLINYKKSLEASGTTSQPVISNEDIQSIFSNIEDLYSIHLEFVQTLTPKVQHWTHNERIGDIFRILILDFDQFITYMGHYQQAVNTIHKCSQESERFQELAEQIVVNSTIKEVTSLEDALFKPVQRVQRNTLVLHDLLKYTPVDHPDYKELESALKLSQYNLERTSDDLPQTLTTQENRRLVKSSFLVELVGGVRKLRYMFLFSDCLICTKRETHRNQKVSFYIKWLTFLRHCTCDTRFAYNDDTKHTQREDIEELKNKIRILKKDMRREMKKYDESNQKHRSIGINLGGAARAVEKMRKKINQYEAQLILASPKLPFKVSINGGKVYTLLMTTDYEREEWREAMISLSKKCVPGKQQQQMDPIFGSELINSVKETPQVNKIGTVLLQKDEDVLNGILNVTIHTLNGLTKECDTYCCIEMDSFGHFFMKARTHICEGSRDPSWNEDFELELEGSQTLRILCFQKQDSQLGDVLLGRGAMELSKSWLKGSFQEKTVAMNELSLVISVRHTSAEKTMSRIPSQKGTAVFGVEISSLAKREGKTVPTIVTACVQEVEKRGLDEVGIYRVSGVTSDLQRIKKLFDKNIKIGAAALTDVDINAVTGILKLYFRELPSPLFTEDAYQSFVDTLRLSDEEAKCQCMLSLLHNLPDTNYYTIVYLFEHLLKVARNVGENKMSIQNLSTIFGPTLLAPAAKETSSDPLIMMSKGAEQAMHQSSIVNYLLGLAVSGRSLRRSAQ